MRRSDAASYFEKLCRGEVEGRSFGWGREVDEITLGAHPEQLIVIGGENKAGKSTFAVNTLAANLNQGMRTLYVTTELTQKWIEYRLVCRKLGISMWQIRKARTRLTSEQKQDVFRYLAGLEDAPLYILDSPYAPFAEVERVVQKWEPDMVIIDHFQRMDHEDDSIPVGYRRLAQRLKQMAVKYEVPVMVLSQVRLEPDWFSFDGSEFTYILQKMRTEWTNSLHGEADMVMYLHNLERSRLPQFRGTVNLIYHSMRDLPSEGYTPVEVELDKQRVVGGIEDLGE